MRISGTTENKKHRGTAAFTLAETIIGMGLAGLMLSAFMACFSFGMGMVRLSREDLRATQILLQRMERVRLCTFDQVRNTTVNPPTATESYCPVAQADGGGGVLYTVTFSNSVPPLGRLPEGYRTNVLLVTATATWTSGNIQHQRSMETYVAREGIAGYVSAP
jgi:type II secretory pathway pseudopilin PulG